ncbi:3'(2'),5'-bisphosphate nucleotidase CysQ [Profundibacter sp.]
MPEHDDLKLLIGAAHASGDIARKFWKQSPETWDKDAGAGPVTEADLAIDRMLHNDLLTARPDYGWLSEETEDNAARLAHDHVFIIDPIDGTRAFIEGSKTFAHSLAIARKGRVTAAVVFLPMLDRLYVATNSMAASLNGRPIKASTPKPDQSPTVLGTKCNFEPDHWKNGAPPFERHFRSSLAYRLCLVAEGRFDAMLTLRPTWEWDVAAGALIAQRAGVCVTDTHGNQPVYNNAHPQLAGMIAAGPDLHKSIHTELANPISVP